MELGEYDHRAVEAAGRELWIRGPAEYPSGVPGISAGIAV